MVTGSTGFGLVCVRLRVLAGWGMKIASQKKRLGLKARTELPVCGWKSVKGKTGTETMADCPRTDSREKLSNETRGLGSS